VNELIPVELYTVFYYNFLVVFVILVLLQSLTIELTDYANVRVKQNIGIGLLILIILYMGSRPISGKYFADMSTYAFNFEKYKAGDPVDLTTNKDLLFEFFSKYCSGIMTVEFYFMVCAALYVVPLYLFARKVFEDYWFYAFLMLVISMSFWGYGVNGIRNGLATSVFLLGLSRKNYLFTIAIIASTYFLHKSMFIVLIAYGITFIHRDYANYLRIWLLAIPLSLLLGGFFETLFLNLGIFANDKVADYLLGGGEEFNDQFSSLGFRWDFLLYSATGVFAGWYFIFVKKIEDKLYIQIYNIYVLVNAFWVLVIRASFSNRFAYLSWFLLGVVIIYPLLKKQLFDKQHLIIGRIIFIYFAFTYVLNVLLVKAK
jgi:hypothetical protein